MWLAPLGVLAASLTLVSLAAGLAPKHKALAIALAGAAMLGLPWLAGPAPLVRGMFGLVNGVASMRIVDLVRSREPWSVRRRILHALSVVDTRLLRRERPRIDVAAIGAGLAWAGLAWAALRVAREAAPPLRWLGGLVLAYAVIDAGYVLARAGYRAMGFVAPPLHVWPLASTSIGELWGARWARPISHFLRETCFRPLARRRRPVLGLLLGFVVSAVLHAYPVLVALGPAMAAMMFGYFALQGLFVLAEVRLGTARWRRPLRRAWTIAIMIGTSPLFVEPALRVLFG